MKSSVLFKLFMTLSLGTLTLYGGHLEESGIWEGDVASDHMFDYELAKAISQFFLSESAESVLDLGCGMGQYTKTILEHSIYCEGYDGNTCTPILTDGVCGVQQLHLPFNLGKTFDWVLCLEVGEHIPSRFETNLIENIDRHARNGVILSWAVVGQGGWGHVNCRNNDYVRTRMESYGYISDYQAEALLRAKVLCCGHFKTTLMVFRKNL